ncbi:MAG TPA: SemiSWEET transporter [Caulobacteraceae bacterium]|jgi:MtN3 and saliva related transmembrane protein
MSLATSVGFAASACTTVSFVPQVVRAWRTRSTGDISLGMFLVFSVGIALWLAYGLMVADAPLIVANAVTLVLALTILALKIRHG